VFDDSDLVEESQNELVIQEMRNQYRAFRIEIVHVDSARKSSLKADFKAALARDSSEGTQDELSKAVDLALKPSVGGNRNWVALLFGNGSSYMMMDDDVHPRVVVHGDEGEGSVSIRKIGQYGPSSASTYPVDVWGSLNRAIEAGFPMAAYGKYTTNP